MRFIKKIQQGFKILKLTGYKYFRASQLKDKEIVYFINHHPVIIKGSYALSMLIEIVSDDIYHLKNQSNPKVIVDVGANIGVFSLYAAALYPHCSVYAFEPSIENFALLKANTKQYENIHCFNKAVSNYNGMANVIDNKNNTALSISAITTENVLHACETVTLSTFIAEYSLDKIDVLKLDCEGAEYDIVKDDISFVEEIVGEYHVIKSGTAEDLKYCFEKQGFCLKEWTGSISGIFWGVNARANGLGYLP